MSQPVTDLKEFTPADFARDDLRECDIVMKGGITSGVIYPLAVCELATVYRLRSVGGASAGAIAAAAEVGRVSGATGASSGFMGLSQFPDHLTKKQDDGRSLLFHLFRPQRSAQRLFSLLTTALDGVAGLRPPVTPSHPTSLAKPTNRPGSVTRPAVRRLVGGLVVAGAQAFPVRALVGALPGVALIGLAGLSIAGAASALGVLYSTGVIIIGLPVALAGLVLGVATGLLSDLGGLSAVGFGLSSGMDQEESETTLTPWLHGQLQGLAGRSVVDPPLTFADLRGAGVNLQMMTTNLSRNQPLALPWNNNVYFFDPEHFRTLFPEAVVQQMIDNPPPLPTGKRDAFAAAVLREQAQPLVPFPSADRLPIVVATRMSLSFPLLISAVPLEAIDYTTKDNRAYTGSVRAWLKANPTGTPEQAAGAMARPSFDKNWFSDGGLAANLPVHFFDSALPTRPTFAIDLAPFAPDRNRSADEWENLYFPTVNSGGLHRRTADWTKKSPLSRLLAFSMSLVSTARVWVDESQLTMPGYRDRIVTVYKGDDEGGLNLSMSEEMVQGLSKRGRYAAQEIKRRFVESAPGVRATGWDNHRWIRFRAATAGLSEWLADFERGYPTPTAPTTPYDVMLAGAPEQPSYKVEGERLKAAKTRVDSLRTEIGRWHTKPADAFTAGRPKPPPELRLTAGDWRSDDQT